jgi:hypothetical protein
VAGKAGHPTTLQRVAFITKNIREAQMRGLFDAVRMLTTDATGPKR